MIEDAEERGLISPGVTTLIEPTSGNMGLGLVLIAIHKGYRFIAVVPAKYSLDKQILLRYMGAELYLTDPALGFQGMWDKVEQLQKELPNVHVLDQTTNKANSEAHFRLTGPEIWKDTAGKVDIFVAASGSGGTVSGVGKYLKMQNPGVQIVCVEPVESPVISGGAPGKHKIQGIGPGFLPEVLDMSAIDETVTVTTEEAMANARRLAKEEGLLVGISSGANLAACLKIASREENKGKMIVTMFPSGGERYMNSDLFADTPSPLCDFEQWIDTEIKLEDKEEMQEMLRWKAEKKETMEKRRREEAAEKEHKEEEERRRVAANREEREKKLERARRAKVAIEENPDALRKGKWHRCT
ncbi:hypothetical protein SETIT_4G074700v2 [Setaria italica]|nr:hypothetical protein SETIT_4G074700v2 [Setaria italica]